MNLREVEVVLAVKLREVADGHAAPITDVAWSASGDRLATASYDGTVLVWRREEISTLKPLCRIRHRRLVNAVAWNPRRVDVLASGAADKTAGVWRIGADGSVEAVAVLARHTDDVNALAWMPSGHELVCVSEDGHATLWNAFSGTFQGEIASHRAHCMDVSISREGLVATVGEDGMVSVIDPKGRQVPRSRSFPTSIEGCSWSPSGLTLAVGGDNGQVLLLDRELIDVRDLEVSTSAVRSVAWSDDGSILVAGAYDGAFHLVAAEDGVRLGLIQEDRLWPRSVDITGHTLVTGSFGATPGIYDVRTAERLSPPVAATSGPNALSATQDALFIGCDSGQVLQISVGNSDTALPTVTETTESPILSLTAGRNAVYAGTYSGLVRKVVGSDQPCSRFLGAPVTSLCLTDIGVVAGTYNGDLFLLDPVQLTIRGRKSEHGGSVKALATLGGDIFASAATDRIVAIGSFADRQRLWHHGNLVNTVAAGPGGLVASGARDHTVKLGLVRPTSQGWTVVRARTLLGPDESVKCVAVLGEASGPEVFAGGYDFCLYYWHVDWVSEQASLAPGSLLVEFDQALSQIVPIGRRMIAVSSWDGSVALVECDSKAGPRLVYHRTITELLARAAR